MDHHKERVKSGCQKILEGINSMSLVNLDDQQVHSLVMMREIARGVVDDRDRKVTKSDVITALRCSIEKMVCASRDIIQILSRISFDGVDDQRMHLVTRMKEIAHRIIDKQPRVAIPRPDLLAEQVGFVDEGMPDSLIKESTKICNNDALIDGALSMTNEDEMLDVGHVLRFENGIDEIQESLLPCFQQFLMWPPDDCVTIGWVQDMMTILEQASQKMLPSEFCHVVPPLLVYNLADAACRILSKEPNCVEINGQVEDSRVIVVGDIHGQFHDLMFIFKHAGVPSENQIYVFNGNYVDKGAWGIEVLMPHRVYLLRGNHESRYCTARYGFKKEVWAKYGDQGEDVYNKFLECFKELPLASVIANCVYTTHGGLFRSIHAAPSQKPKRNKIWRVDLGSLAELSEANRSCVDCPYEGPNILLSDVLWSGPSNRYGLRYNTGGQKLGLLWGPDCTEAFLKQHNLKSENLIGCLPIVLENEPGLSHEGPDARAGRDDDLGDMLCGYSIDHDGESGKLCTLFSAPDYPQFGKRRCDNKGAYAVLKSPDFASPSFHSFKGTERPMVDPYVDFGANNLDSSKLDSSQSASTSTLSASERFYPEGMKPEFDFGALGLYNAPCWSVELPDGSGGTQVVEVPRASIVEGLPLPPNIQEPHKAAYEYLFELVAGLKHMIVTRETENRARMSALRSKARKRKACKGCYLLR
ncbi:unnamed protein product [Sphenostylis stenocarpa]|uniref:Serine/threonine-protein phosphatase n=1 Tax=Sphenostylis stenocarpa TaxID=92480 RepID=A0AA86SQT5_9FABA|nr:unnamed protein product [Sphenostylis stenocarpa]